MIERRNIFATKEDLEEHKQFSNSSFSEIKTDIKEIKENHLRHLQDSFNTLSEDVTEIRTDVSWLKSFFWVIAAASIGGLITGIFNAIVK